jgi:orotidine-5'-phosphate decarboxylase
MSDDRLIVALDVPNIIAGMDVVNKLGATVSFYKIGLGMLTGGGLALADELKQEHNKRIFLDLKLFDIGATVEAAVKGIAKYELDFLTVHGDPNVVKAAKEGAADSNLKILAVTILTSLDREDLNANMYKSGDISDLVVERADRAFQAGADGVITSPLETKKVKGLISSSDKLIVTPGVRPEGAELGDQKRFSTPGDAIKNGSNHIVVGRPIITSADPKAAAHNILTEINNY